MRKIIIRRKIALFIRLAIYLLSCISLTLNQAQSEEELSKNPPLNALETSVSKKNAPLISMDFQDANLKDVLKVFSQQAGLNFIASEKIKERKITLYLDKVSVEDALDNIMNANNLTYVLDKKSKIFVVKEQGELPLETLTKVFPLQYAQVKGYELSSQATGKSASSADIGITTVISKMVSADGRVIEDSRTNSLIVTDIPHNFAQIEKTIKELDVKLPQVMIEAEVVEASLEAIDKLGIEWGSSSDGDLMAISGSARTTNWPFGKGLVHGTFSGTAGSVSAANLQATLSMLSRDTDTKILARPRILTLNNCTAEIKITAETAISAEETTVSTGEGLGTSVTSAERVETGIVLGVTPQINQEGEITMLIEPSVINTKASAYFDDIVDPQKRSASTTVSVRDGETIIIGGLINSEDSKILRKVPFLADIPLLGNIFRKREDEVTDKELIIFITPHLIKQKTQTPRLTLERPRPREYGSATLNQRRKVIGIVLDELEE